MSIEWLGEEKCDQLGDEIIAVINLMFKKQKMNRIEAIYILQHVLFHFFESFDLDLDTVKEVTDTFLESYEKKLSEY